MWSTPRPPWIVSSPEPPARWSPAWLPMIEVVAGAAVGREADPRQVAAGRVAEIQAKRPRASMTSLPSVVERVGEREDPLVVLVLAVRQERERVERLRRRTRSRARRPGGRSTRPRPVRCRRRRRAASSGRRRQPHGFASELQTMCGRRRCAPRRPDRVVAEDGQLTCSCGQERLALRSGPGACRGRHESPKLAIVHGRQAGDPDLLADQEPVDASELPSRG